MARERNTLFEWSTRLAENIGVPTFPITRLASSVSQGIIDTVLEEGADLILMPWSDAATTPATQMGRVLGPVIRRAPCDLAVVAYHSGGPEGQGPGGPKEVRRSPATWHPGSILVPTAGGPHAPLAVRIALSLAREYGASVTVVYVARPDSSPEEMAEGRERIQQTIAAMREQADALSRLNGQVASLEEIPIESRVITAGSVVAGIAQAGARARPGPDRRVRKKV